MKNLLKSRNTGLIAVLIILLVIARFLTPGMFTATSLVSMLQNNTIYALLAIAEMMVILTGGIDISIASQLAFVGISCTTLACSHPGIPGSSKRMQQSPGLRYYYQCQPPGKGKNR